MQTVAACWTAGAWRSIEPGITKTAPLMLSTVPMAGGLLGMNVPGSGKSGTRCARMQLAASRACAMAAADGC